MTLDLIIFSAVYIFIYLPRWHKQRKLHFFLKSIFYWYLVLVFLVTLTPFFSSIPHIFDHPYRFMNLNPFVDIVEHHLSAVEDVLLNLCMLIPLGVFLPAIYHQNFKKTVQTAFLLSASIELLQPLISTTRAGDITDIITNTMGACIGYIIYLQQCTQFERIHEKSPQI